MRRVMGTHTKGCQYVSSDYIDLLGGSWVVISGVTSKVTIVIIHIRGLITPFLNTHEPPSSSSSGKHS